MNYERLRIFLGDLMLGSYYRQNIYNIEVPTAMKGNF